MEAGSGGDPDADLSEVVQEVLRDGRVTMRQLAEASGLSYQTLRSWSIGRRTPKDPEHLHKLADALDRQSERLEELAQELRQVAADE